MKQTQGKLTPKQAMSLLAKEGIVVSEDEARQILELIDFLAELTIKQILIENE